MKLLVLRAGVVVAFMAKWKPASLHVYLFGVFGCCFFFSSKWLESYIRRMQWNKIQMLQSPKGPIAKTKFKKGQRKNSRMAGCEFQKCSSFHTQNKLWSDLKKLFGSYLLQLREAERKEEVTESYFMGFSPSGSYNICCLKPLEQGWHSSTLSSFHWLSQQLPIKRFRT